MYIPSFHAVPSQAEPLDYTTVKICVTVYNCTHAAVCVTTVGGQQLKELKRECVWCASHHTVVCGK